MFSFFEFSEHRLSLDLPRLRVRFADMENDSAEEERLQEALIIPPDVSAAIAMLQLNDQDGGDVTRPLTLTNSNNNINTNTPPTVSPVPLAPSSPLPGPATATAIHAVEKAPEEEDFCI